MYHVLLYIILVTYFRTDGGAGWSRSSNYTMTVSVIVPLVISVFLLVILCVLFFLIRRCHNARAQEMDRDTGIIPTISGGIGRRSKGLHISV